MVLVNVRITNDHEGDRNVANRILRGINGLSEKGYIVEKYERIVYGEKEKRPNEIRQLFLAVMQTDEAEDVLSGEWLPNLLGKGKPKEPPPTMPDTDTAQPDAYNVTFDTNGAPTGIFVINGGTKQFFNCVKEQSEAPAIHCYAIKGLEKTSLLK